MRFILNFPWYGWFLIGIALIVCILLVGSRIGLTFCQQGSQREANETEPFEMSDAEFAAYVERVMTECPYLDEARAQLIVRNIHELSADLDFFESELEVEIRRFNDRNDLDPPDDSNGGMMIPNLTGLRGLTTA